MWPVSCWLLAKQETTGPTDNGHNVGQSCLDRAKEPKNFLFSLDEKK
jgi:hypothetical protein